ncbi:hypothetical protein OIDMADRAFT_134537 [Oidiodendron maius Zn]|uniref:Uncharacterized protein n=1 Tax=Oidiodendron maius (strain Zn) TaxID=913774 RepID=A0A0C3GH20_OIDMZ|nr:hypothetical protein OIDMADRAFT_134537 [Oidiodendron maius Zn]
MEQSDSHELRVLPQTQAATHESAQNSTGRLPTSCPTLGRRAQPIRYLLITFTLSLVFSVLYILFINYVLIRGNVQIGTVSLSASTTNLLVSIFSQISATGGILATTFLGLGSATSWLQVLNLAFVDRFLNFWCDFSLLLPSMSIAFGSILKFRANFDYYFIPSNLTVSVFAGLVPIDLRVLKIVPISDQCQFLQSWTASLLTNSKYAKDTIMNGCNDGCRAFLLPGGLELVRQFGPFLNYSIFYGGVFDGAESVRIDNAPGMITTFQTPETELTFDPVAECIYGGKAINDSLQICMRQVDHSIAVGWTACPQTLFDNNECSNNLTWTSGPVIRSTVMSLYRQFTTTTYNAQNLSMVNTQSTSDAELMFLNVSDYTTILNEVLVPNENSSQSDNISINALTYALTWMHRTYDEVFPSDKNSLITNLYNFLVIPQLFMVTAVQLCNYTVIEDGLEAELGNFPMPDDMVTTATGGLSTSRLVILPWTGYLFIAINVVVLLFILGGLVWILFQPHALPSSTGVDELDSLRLAEKALYVRPATNGERNMDSSALIKLACNLDLSSSSRRQDLRKTLRGSRIEIMEDTEQAEAQNLLHATDERLNSPSGSSLERT